MIGIALLAGLFGLLIGSFLNVCIYRWPRDLSVVRPRSFCPECEKPIGWYDNIPLASYLLLARKCRHCGKPIPLRYPVVEAVTATLFFCFVAALGPTLVAFKYCLLAALLVGMLFSDLEQRILPDEFTIGGVVIGLALSWFLPVRDGTAQMLLWFAHVPLSGAPMSLAESAVGAFLPSGFLWLTGEIFFRLRHKEGLGFGDVKMIAAVGAFLGLRGALLTLILGTAAGSVLGLIFILATKKDSSSYELPLGTFLGVAGIGVALSWAGVLARVAKII
jgi:leader peptidase (prepilin peptidase)/N-methyltransferase